jgi:hypothetical protein
MPKHIDYAPNSPQWTTYKLTPKGLPRRGEDDIGQLLYVIDNHVDALGPMLPSQMSAILAWSIAGLSAQPFEEVAQALEQQRRMVSSLPALLSEAIASAWVVAAA